MGNVDITANFASGAVDGTISGLGFIGDVEFAAKMDTSKVTSQFWKAL